MRPFLFLILVCAACSGNGEPSQQPAGLVLVTIDTLRADHVSCYGYGRQTTPHLDRLAAEGLLFENAYATMATTLPSHLSMLTGLYPHQHGVESNLGAIGSPFVSGDGRRSIAEYLGDVGWETAAFLSSAPLSSATGIHVGFQHVDEPKGAERKGDETVQRALAWLEGRQERDRPYFLWIHLWDVHDPNVPPPGYAERFAGDGLAEQLVTERGMDAAVLTEAFGPAKRARHFYPDQLAKAQRRGKRAKVDPVTEAGLADLLNRYDGDVFYTDERLGELLAGLGEDLARLAVVVTADHGQGLGQRDWLEHGITTPECVRVPLVIRFPDALQVAPARVQRVVSLIDLVPTVLGQLQPPGWKAFSAQSTGTDSLGPSAEEAPALAVRVARDRKVWTPGEEAAIALGPWRLISRTDAEPELYNRESDPDELNNVAAEHPEVVAELADRLASLLAERPAGEDAQGTLDPAAAARQRAALESLGYAGED